MITIIEPAIDKAVMPNAGPIINAKAKPKAIGLDSSLRERAGFSPLVGKKPVCFVSWDLSVDKFCSSVNDLGELSLKFMPLFPCPCEYALSSDKETVDTTTAVLSC